MSRDFKSLLVIELLAYMAALAVEARWFERPLRAIDNAAFVAFVAIGFVMRFSFRRWAKTSGERLRPNGNLPHDPATS